MPWNFPEHVRDDLIVSWAPVVELEPSGPRVVRFAEGEPLYITILGAAAQWVTPLKLASTVFLGRLAQLAADDLWKNKGKIAQALREEATSRIGMLAEALGRAREQAQRPVTISLGLPIPDDHFGTVVRIDARKPVEEIAVAIAVLTARAEEIEGLLRAEELAGNDILGGVDVSIEEDLSLTLTWTTRGFGRIKRRIETSPKKQIAPGS